MLKRRLLLRPEKILVFILLTVLVAPQAEADSAGAKYKGSLELLYHRNNLLVRIKPIDFTSPPNSWGMEAMIGRRFGSLNAYAYFKANLAGSSWLGTRLETTLKDKHNRFNATIQLRTFKGLNRQSEDHIYIIPYLNASLDRTGNFRAGFLGIGKAVRHQRAVFFLGPAVTLRVNRHIRFRLSAGDDVLGKGELVYLKSYISL